VYFEQFSKGAETVLKRKKKIITLLFAAKIFLFALSAGVSAEQTNLNLQVEGAILIEANTGQVIYEQDPHQRWAPASVTKVMTMLLAMEAVKEGKATLNDIVLASEFACSFGGSQVYLEPGEKFTLHELLIAVAVGSANDASVAVAEHISGSNEAFVEAMNAKARELGLENTNFVNTHGLDDENHYTSAYDMAQISKYLLNNYPEILQYTGMKFYVFREEPLLELYNTNKMLWWYEGTDGLKTGFTSTAKRSLASTVKREGLRLIGVVMGVEQKHGHFRESMKLYNYGFSQFKFNKLFDKGQEVKQLPVSKGEVDQISVVAQDPVGFMSKKGEKVEPEIILELPEVLAAPLQQGQTVGEIIIRQSGYELARVKLVVPFEVKRATLWRQLNKLTKQVY
jgi:D-alanyl-D-alanine carboxypeptidase (penicillin-binding protein 5/6)